MRSFGGRIHAAQQHLVAPAQFHQFVPRRPRAPAAPAHRDHVAQHLDAEFAQQRLGHGAHRHPRRRFAGAGALQNVARVVEIVLDGARQIGVARPRTRHRLALVLAALDVFHRQRFGPVLPVLVADQNGHRRADGVGMAHAGHDLRRSVSIFMRPPRP
jgi:hypothetical protein